MVYIETPVRCLKESHDKTQYYQNILFTANACYKVHVTVCILSTWPNKKNLRHFLFAQFSKGVDFVVFPQNVSLTSTPTFKISKLVRAGAGNAITAISRSVDFCMRMCVQKQ